jgi:hypothetical protein
VVSNDARPGVRSTSGPVPLSYSSVGEMRKSCWGDSPTRDVGAQNRVSAPTRSALLTQPPVAVQRGAPKTVRRTTSEAKLAGARPPREASPAKVASDGQHNDDDDDDPKPGRHVILSSGACRLYDEPTRIRKRVRAYAAMGTAHARTSAHASRARRRAMHARARVKLLVSRRGSRTRRRVGVDRASLWRAAWPARRIGANQVCSSHAVT